MVGVFYGSQIGSTHTYVRMHPYSPMDVIGTVDDSPVDDPTVEVISCEVVVVASLNRENYDL